MGTGKWGLRTEVWELRGPGGEPSKGHQHVANKRHATRICRRFFGCSLANATLQNYYDLYGLWECALKHTRTLSFERGIGDRGHGDRGHSVRHCECRTKDLARIRIRSILSGESSHWPQNFCPLRQNRKLSWHNSFYFPFVLSSCCRSSSRQPRFCYSVKLG